MKIQQFNSNVHGPRLPTLPTQTSHFGQLPVEGNANTRRPLVCANGVYGRRIAEILRRLQLPTGFAMLEFEENTVVCPDQVGEVSHLEKSIFLVPQTVRAQNAKS